MSTRSGKRIHSTVDENTVENVVDTKCERNTRSRRQKANSNLPLTEKKRKHYVRYPSEEDVSNAFENINTVAKNMRKSRSQTLKEQNALLTDSETSNEERRTVRSTHRTKKIEANNDESGNVENTVREGKKKNKKKKQVSLITEDNTENIPEVQTITNTKKKSKKKNKSESNSLTVDDITQTVSDNHLISNVSNDSFHSAAGSPISKEQCSSNIVSEYIKFKNNKKNNFKGNVNMASAEKLNRKRKLTNEMEFDIPNSLPDSFKNKPSTETIEVRNVVNKLIDMNNSMQILSKSLESRNKKSKPNKTSTDEKNNIITFEIDNTNKEGNLSNIKLSPKSPPNTFDNDNKEEKLKTLNSTFDKKISDQNINNITYSGSKKKRKSSIKNSTYDKINNTSILNLDATFEKNSSINKRPSMVIEPQISKHSSEHDITNLNSTYDKTSQIRISNSLNATFDKEIKLDSTFDKNMKKSSMDQFKMEPRAKSSLISSDSTNTSTINMTNDHSSISITSDDSKTENIINATPVLIESSMDESKTNNNTFTSETKKTPLKREDIFTVDTKTSNQDLSTENTSKIALKADGTFTEDVKSPKLITSESKCTTPLKNRVPKTPTSTKKCTDMISEVTPLKREGTFTKNSSETSMSPRLSTQLTPRRKSLPSPGCTPFPLSKSSCNDKRVLNITRSIEKSRRSSEADLAPRITRVMFCSPVNNPAAVTQMKGRVIKSNLKGSNKSFVFDESVSEQPHSGRKRSYTQRGAEPERSRPRTPSAAARLQEPDTPTRGPSKAEGGRTKLPNFAALHQKQFQRMESLDECVLRKAKRARQLLTPATPTQTLAEPQKELLQQINNTIKKIETPKSKTKDPNPGFTRFGFKLNLDVNPFSVPPKNTEIKPKEKPVTLKRQATLPSLAGATALRREIAKQTVMREKSFPEKRHVVRDENRTVIKGVRTNRRFELQMKMRNINNK